MRGFWPVAEAAQADYETLRAAVLAETALASQLAVRFATGGLAALIAQPISEPAFSGALIGAKRPPWTPRGDPRLEVLGAGYHLLLKVLAGDTEIQTRKMAQ